MEIPLNEKVFTFSKYSSEREKVSKPENICNKLILKIFSNFEKDVGICTVFIFFNFYDKSNLRGKGIFWFMASGYN